MLIPVEVVLAAAAVAVPDVDIPAMEAIVVEAISIPLMVIDIDISECFANFNSTSPSWKLVIER
jgi:hypothetical protein